MHNFFEKLLVGEGDGCVWMLSRLLGKEKWLVCVPPLYSGMNRAWAVKTCSQNWINKRTS